MQQCGALEIDRRETAVLLIVGHDGAGKSTVAKCLARRFDVDVLEFGELVRERMASDLALGGDPSIAYRRIQKIESPGWLTREAENFLHRVPRSSAALILVGLRDLEAWEALQSRFPSLVTIAVDTPFEVRRARLARRRERPLGPKELFERDSMHASWGLERLMEDSDLIIEGVDSAADMCDNAYRWLQKHWQI